MLDNKIVNKNNNDFPLNRYDIINKFKGNCVNFIMGNCDGTCNLIHSLPLKNKYIEELEKTLQNKVLCRDSKQIKEEFKGFCSEFIVSNCTNINCRFYHSIKLRDEYDLNKNQCYCSYYLKYGNCRIDWCKYIHDNTAHENYKTNLENSKIKLENLKKNNIEPSYCIFWENKCCSDTKCKFVHNKNTVCNNFFVDTVKKEQINIISNTDAFIGLLWSSNSMLCKKFNCDCSRHNMLDQTQTNTGVIFDTYIRTKKISLTELIMKLNKIYFDNFLIIQSQLTKDNFIDNIKFPNNNLSLQSLEKLFNIIENNEIYETNLTQTEYSLLYEIFRRCKQCPKNKYFSNGIIYDCNNKPNYCYYGRNCIKGHHGFNGICSDDLYYNKCNCINNLNEIKSLEEEILQINNKNIFSNDEYIYVNDIENKKKKIKQIKKKIEYLESTNLLHLNRDGYCTDFVNYKNIDKNFTINTNDTNIILNKMLEVKSCDDYNNYIINEKNKPSCYFVYNMNKTDFAIDHNWSKEKWEYYINFDKNLNLCLYFTFSNFQNISKTILPIYNNPLNDEKDWLKFLINLNSKLCLINNFSNSIVHVKNTSKKLYSNKINFIINDYFEIDDEYIKNNNFNHVSYKSDISEELDYEIELDNNMNLEFVELDDNMNLEIKDIEYDIEYEKITLTKKEKYFISYESIDSSINFGPITNYEFNLLKKINGVILNKKNINNVQVINIPIKINIANDIVNKICQVLKLKYSSIKNNTECDFLISLNNM